MEDPTIDLLGALFNEENRGDIKDIKNDDSIFDKLEKKNETSEDEKEDNDEESTYCSDSSNEYDPANLNIPTLGETIENPTIIKKAIKVDKFSNHARLQNEVNELLETLEQDEIPVPDKMKDLARRQNLDVQRLYKIRNALKDLYDTQITAGYLTDWIIQASVMISVFFDGGRTIPLLNIKPNFTGYSTKVKKETNRLNKENTRVARKINRSIGKSASTLFNWASILVLPAFITLGNNHTGKKITDRDKYDDLDSDEEESEKSSDEEESDVSTESSED